jgi:hypothetical protein
MIFVDIAHGCLMMVILWLHTCALFRGEFSVVMKGVEKATGEVYAIKCIEKDMMEPGRLETEIEILKSVSHPHIISLKEYFESKSSVYLVMELYVTTQSTHPSTHPLTTAHNRYAPPIGSRRNSHTRALLMMMMQRNPLTDSLTHSLITPSIDYSLTDSLIHCASHRAQSPSMLVLFCVAFAHRID